MRTGTWGSCNREWDVGQGDGGWNRGCIPLYVTVKMCISLNPKWVWPGNEAKMCIYTVETFHVSASLPFGLPRPQTPVLSISSSQTSSRRSTVILQKMFPLARQWKEQLQASWVMTGLSVTSNLRPSPTRGSLRTPSAMSALLARPTWLWSNVPWQ